MKTNYILYTDPIDGYYKLNTNISKNQWKEYFLSKTFSSLTTKTKKFLERYYTRKNECGCFSDIYKEFEEPISNSYIRSLTNSVIKYFKIENFTVHNPDSNLAKYSQKWPMFFYGKHFGKNQFEWKLKPEIVQAIDELDEFRQWHIKKQNKEKMKSLVELTKTLEQNFNKSSLAITEKEAIVKTRIGQSYFRDFLLQRDKKCCICGLHHSALLIASHIKPWKDSNHEERLDMNNGLLLCSIHDSLFDKHLISFDKNGKILISHKLSLNDKKILNLNDNISLNMNTDMKKYMSVHRNTFNKLNKG